MSQERVNWSASASRDGNDRHFDGQSDHSDTSMESYGHGLVADTPVLTLVKAIEGEVIPRLMLARRADEIVEAGGVRRDDVGWHGG